MIYPLNKLEAAVLAVMCERCANPEFLRAQINKAIVLNRTNTGVGIFTELQVPLVCGPVTEKVIDNVFAKIKGCQNPMVFVLFLHDGHIKTLEGAAVEDSTAGFDFLSVTFSVT